MIYDNLLFLIVIMILPFNEAFACTCIGESSVKSAIKSSDVVLNGRILTKETFAIYDSSDIEMFHVDSMSSNATPEQIFMKYVLAVDEVFKGKRNLKEIEIISGVGGGDCGNNFDVGKDYIIYGSKQSYFGNNNEHKAPSENKNVFWTNICTRTQELHSKEIEQIRSELNGRKRTRQE